MNKNIDKLKKGPGRPRDPGKEAAIAGAAQRLFLERGFDGTSIDAIADAAGVAKATVYAHFGDKEGLLRAAIEAKCASMFEGEASDASGRTLRQGLREFAHRFLALITDRDALAMHALMAEAGKSGPDLPQLFFESAVLPTCKRMSRYLGEEAAKGRLVLENEEEAAWRFLGMVKAQEHMRALLGLPPRSKEVVDLYVESCVDAFLAAHSPR